MDTGEHDPTHDLSDIRNRPRKPSVLPCGGRVCLRCHKGCGVVMAAYLSGLDDLPEINEQNP